MLATAMQHGTKSQRLFPYSLSERLWEDEKEKHSLAALRAEAGAVQWGSAVLCGTKPSQRRPRVHASRMQR